MPASRLGVDLSSDRLRVVEGLPGGPMRSGEAVVPAGAIQAGRVVDPQAVGQALRQLVARSEISTSRALIAAADSVASFRVMTFPRDAIDADVEASVHTNLDLGADHMVHRHFDLPSPASGERAVFAAVWDRRQVAAIGDAVKMAGLDPAAVDLKSLCLARAIGDDSCVLVDLMSDPAEAVLIDGRIPRVWHSFKAEMDGDLALSIADGLRSVLGFHQRAGALDFGPASPILVRADPPLAFQVTARLEDLTGRPVKTVEPPPRIDAGVRYMPYLTCLGLIMRRSV